MADKDQPEVPDWEELGEVKVAVPENASEKDVREKLKFTLS